MPIYGYTCQDCEHEQDLIRRISERNDPAECEECGGELERIEIVQTGIPKFKGRGFYATEYDTDHPWRLHGVDDHPPENVDEYRDLDAKD